jgi:phosphoglucosamine mutase
VPRLFGTDGVRGLANGVLTPELALGLAVGAAHVLAEAGSFAGHRPTAVVGRDGRASGEMLEAAVVAGLTSAGVDVLRVGVLPTPAVAHVTAVRGADLGVMLSASHNAMPDNGVKFFARGGHKLPDDVEDAIEARLGEAWLRPTGAGVGRVRDDARGPVEYVEHLLAAGTTRLDGLRVVVDCANGAASSVSPEALRRAGADVVAVAAEPDGLNINDGVGSTHLDHVAAAVREHRADVGIAHDGDADRCLAVDASGQVVDGDQILAVTALALREQGRLRDDAVVTTVMTNLGFHRAMAAHGVRVVTTPVGDRYVLEALRRERLSLGGEQSGHVVFLEWATTGDGVLTALRLLSRMAETGAPLAELAAVVERLPQVLVNVRADRSAAQHPDVLAALADEERVLAGAGRVLLRPSGTEPLVRVMVEAPTAQDADGVAQRLARVVARAGAR